MDIFYKYFRAVYAQTKEAKSAQSRLEYILGLELTGTFCV